MAFIFTFLISNYYFMKQLLLILMAMTFAIGLYGQEIIWEEDFSDGQHGWTVNTSFCENYGGPEFGVWTLVSGTVDGEAVDISDGFYRWSFTTPIDYTISFADGVSTASATNGTVYSRYEMSNDTLISMIDGTQVVADGTAFEEQSANGIVDWATSFDVGDNLSTVMRFIGVDQPTITFTNAGQNFTYRGEDGAVVLEFEKEAECGSFWMWSPNGNVGYGLNGLNPGLVIGSETQTNGAMIINSLYNTSLGDPDYTPDGPPPFPFYISELISPAIDISAADAALSLQLSQIVAYLNTPGDAPDGLKTSFAVSNDDGVSWSPAFDVNPGFETNALRNNTVTTIIPSTYIQGADEIRIKFTWAGDFYTWGIDDIAIIERTGYEMQANDNFFAIATNAVTPASQVESLFWLADIQNNGGVTADNVILNLTIVNEEGVEVYNEDNLYGSITSDSLAENSFFDEPLATEFQLPGVYTGTYVLTHDSSSVDQNMTNETLEFQFTVSDTLFAKETGRTRGLAPTGELSWYMGNCFYVPNGDGWYGRYVSFMVENADDIAANSGTVTIHLYESDGDLDDNGRIEGDELGINGGAIALNEYIFTGDENQEMITLPIDLNEEGVPLQDGKYYLLVIQYVASGTEQIFLSSSEEYDYSANSFITDSLMMPRYSDVVALGIDDPSYFRGGFSGSVVPVVRMSIGTNPDLAGDAIVATNNILSDDYQMLVFPNPSDLEVKLQLDLPEQQDVNVRLFDQNGRLLLSRDYEKLDHGLFTYDVSKLPSGTYWVQLSTAVGIKTEKIIVSH